MAQTEFVGLNQTFSWNGGALSGVRKVTLVEEDGPSVEQLDVTTCTDSAYTYLADPLGAKGNAKVTMTVELLDAYDSYSLDLQTKLAFNTKEAVVWCMEPDTATANQYDHTALELTSRTTEIYWDQYSTCTLVFEGTVVGTWSSPS